MEVSEDEVAEVPAAGRAPRALVLHAKEGGKQGDEALALALALVAPDTHLPGVCGVVHDLRRPGVDDDAEGDMSPASSCQRRVIFAKRSCPP